MPRGGLRIALAASFLLGAGAGAGACNEKKTSETAATVDANDKMDATMPAVIDASDSLDASEAGDDGNDAAAEDASPSPSPAGATSPGEGDGGGRRDADAGSVTRETAASSDGGMKRVPVALDESGAGKSIGLAVGQSLTLSLGANPTSGFDWSVLKAPAALGAPAMSYVQGGSQMGAPGLRKVTWTLKSALPAGEHAVELGYARSFEKGVAPFKTFAFKVRAAR